jgi:hypothetical protein
MLRQDQISRNEGDVVALAVAVEVHAGSTCYSPSVISS